MISKEKGEEMTKGCDLSPPFPSGKGGDRRVMAVVIVHSVRRVLCDEIVNFPYQGSFCFRWY